MIIAVDIPLIEDKRAGMMSSFYRQVFKSMAGVHPEHRFVFIAEKHADSTGKQPSNVQTARLPPTAANYLLRRFRDEFKLSSLLKKYNADVFVSTNGNRFLKTGIPQCIILINGGTGKRRLSKLLNKASLVVTSSVVQQQKIEELYKISPRKTVVIHPAASSFFKPVLQEQREKIKEKYCEGKEYFFCKVIDDQVVLINLLKAFSQFKKMQKSGMKFLFATNFSGKASSFMQSFATYKYREDVILLNNLSEEETALITASAYAAVIPFSNEETMITVLEALQSGVPAIVSENAAVKEITGEASLYSDITNPKDTGEKLMRIYIDENLRTQLAERGKQVAPSYSSQKTAELLLQAILQVVK